MTLQICAVNNFDSLPYEEAKRVIYKDLLPHCEAKGVYLSQSGNLRSPDTMRTANFLSPVDEYTYKNDTQELLDIERIQRAFQVIDKCVQETSHFQKNSGALKVKIENWQHEDLSYGDFVAAMMLKGYAARFASRGDPLRRCCEFRAMPRVDSI
jgi:hypothetical protein